MTLPKTARVPCCFIQSCHSSLTVLPTSIRLRLFTIPMFNNDKKGGISAALLIILPLQ